MIWAFQPTNGGHLKGVLAFIISNDLNFHLIGSGDFDGDSKTDLLWHNSSTGHNALWLVNGGHLKAAHGLAVVSDTNWTIPEAK